MKSQVEGNKVFGMALTDSPMASVMSITITYSIILAVIKSTFYEVLGVLGYVNTYKDAVRLAMMTTKALSITQQKTDCEMSP